MKKENIILVGYMGCGKSTVGKKLSFVLKQPYLDTDKLIEQKQNCQISEIFDIKGEAFFRDLETECVESLFVYKQKHVISVGGGLVLREKNRELLKQLGTVVYLRATPDTIFDRLKGDTTRPLLRGENPYQKICDMIIQRGPVYQQSADIILDVDGLSVEEVADQIEKELNL